jgi:hypothetical protein
MKDAPIKEAAKQTFLAKAAASKMSAAAANEHSQTAQFRGGTARLRAKKASTGAFSRELRATGAQNRPSLTDRVLFTGKTAKIPKPRANYAPLVIYFKP